MKGFELQRSKLCQISGSVQILTFGLNESPVFGHGSDAYHAECCSYGNEEGSEKRKLIDVDVSHFKLGGVSGVHNISSATITGLFSEQQRLKLFT